MNLIIVFLGIIAIAEVGSLIFNARNHTAQKSIDLLSSQLERERDMYSAYRKQFEKELATQKDATNLWAKKYFELEIQLKKYEPFATSNLNPVKEDE